MATSFIASSASRRSLRARLAGSGLLAALSAFACGGEADQNGPATNGGRSSSGGTDASTSGIGSASAGGSTAVAGTGGTTAGTSAGGAGSTTGASSGGGVPTAGASSGGWTLPHTSDKSWRNSKEPLCAPGGYGLPLDIWSDERGVYALAETDTFSTSLAFNDGSGWSPVPEADGTFFGISGFRDGPLALYGGDHCGVLLRDGDVETCASPLPRISKLFVVDSTRAFALAGNRLLRYSGSYFTLYGKPLPELSPVYGFELWADAEVVIVAGDESLYFFGEGAAEIETVALPEPFPQSLWAFSRDDIWVGLGEGRLAHYDGQLWTLMQLGLECGSVRALWGSDYTLFAASSTMIARVNHDEITVLAEASRCPPEETRVGSFEELVVRKIWGNSPTEVFFAFTERMFEVYDDGMSLQVRTTDPDACGMQRLYWSDGERLRPL